MRQHVENLHIYTVLLSPCVMPQCTSDVNGVMRATFTSIKMISLIKPITSIKTNSHISKKSIKTNSIYSPSMSLNTSQQLKTRSPSMLSFISKIRLDFI